MATTRGCLAGAVILLGAWSSPALAGPPLDGASIARDLKAGKPVVEEGKTIRGDVDLAEAEEVKRVFKCRRCTFRGRIRAADVTFHRTVDLSGSTFTRDVDFHGATFEGPALFRTALTRQTREEPRPASFQRGADFSLALFQEFLSFSGSSFDAAPTFEDARFADVSFTRSQLPGATFDRASLRGAALFNAATFSGPATFEDVDFRGRTDFSSVFFVGGASFEGTQFANGASYLGTQFIAPSARGRAATFQDIAAGGDLKFNFATFQRLPPEEEAARSAAARRKADDLPDPIATFSNVVGGGSLELADTDFAGEPLIVTRLQVRDLIMDIDVVKQIDDEVEQRAVLDAIEQSAKNRGDLAQANDAHYALRVLRSKDYSDFWKGVDFILFRWTAGYLVRPMRPLVLLLVFVSLSALVYTFLRRDQALSKPIARRLRPGRVRRGFAHCGNVLGCFLDTFALVVPRARGDGGTLPVFRRVEIAGYRVLVVLVLIGLANSNPTLREMVDALL